MQQLAFEKIGSGPPLVLLHGTNSTAHETWGPCLDELARSYTLVMPELPGGGHSPLPVGPIDTHVVAAQVVDAAAGCGYREFPIAGASLGGAVALATAARFPDRVSHAVSVNGYATPRPSLRTRFELWESILDNPPEVMGRLLLTLGMSDQAFAALPPEVLRDTITAFGARRVPGLPLQLTFAKTIDIEASLTGIQTPTLVIAGATDTFVAPAHSRHLARHLPKARLLMFAAGHGLPHELPSDVAAAIIELTGAE